MSSPTESPVGERLARLAEHAPTQRGDPGALWSQGRRRQRARWAGTAACLVLLAALGGVAVPAALERPADLVAVSPGSPLRLPDVVRQPGEWEPSFPQAPGPLVAVGTGTRGGWWSSRPAVWGVSAATGESRFLELPDAATNSDAAPALSADGRRLAYWITGETLGEPLRVGGLDPAVGVAVMDLVTGEVERWARSTPRGMATYALAWSGDVLWWSGADYSEDSTPSQYGGDTVVWTWDLGSGDQRENGALGDISYELAGRSGSAPGGLLVPGRRRHPVLALVRGDQLVRDVRAGAHLDSQAHRAPQVAPDGGSLAGLLEPEDDTGGTPLPLVVGGLDRSPVAMHVVGDVATTALFGWRSPDEVVVGTYAGDGADRVYGAATVDVETATVTPLVAFRGNVPSFAADAWSAEVVEAPDAPWRPDPRLTGLFLLVAGALVLSLANSVRRRRAGA